MSAALRSVLSFLAAIAGAFALLFAVTGCDALPGSERTADFASPLAGTDDVELTYEIDTKASTTRSAFGDDLRALVLRRLTAARVGADVSEEQGRVRIVVDEAFGPLVDELVMWTGTLLFLEADPAVVLSAREAVKLQRMSDGTEVWFEGERADVMRAIDGWPIDRDHRILAEPIWGNQKTPTRWRTRVVRATPALELADGALVGWADGPKLRIRGVSDSPAATVIATAKARTTPLVLARGPVSLGHPRFDDGDALFLEFGEGAQAYARAQSERQLLTTARLPPLRRIDAVGLPPNRVLALACLVVPIALSLGWLAFVRRFDRAHPEPLWLIGVTFVLGALSTVPAALIEMGFARLSPWLDPSLVTFGGRPFALPLSFVVLTVVVGLSEEGAKRFAAQLATRRPEFDEPVDGIVYAIVAALGFAAAENVRYFALGRMNAPLVIARCFMSIPAHMFFSALWGYALGAKLVTPRTRVWRWLLLAAACHGMFDALLSTEDAGLLAVLLNVGLASVFVALVRRSLRHGVVSSEVRAAAGARALFRVGRPLLFGVSAVLLHVLAFGIFLLGAYLQLARHRPSLGFVAGSSAMLTLLAVAALGVAQTLPLDVAIDAYGVTFAGAARAWRQIRAFTVARDRVTLDCEGGPILLGPGSPAVIDAMAAELRKRLSDSGDNRLHTLESRQDPR